MKKRNDFIIKFQREKIKRNGMNDFFAEAANIMLFFLSEDECVKQRKSWL